MLLYEPTHCAPATATLNKIIPLEIRSPLFLAISCSAWVHKCVGAQKKGEGVHWLALACTDPILCAHDPILFYGW